MTLPQAPIRWIRGIRGPDSGSAMYWVILPLAGSAFAKALRSTLGLANRRLTR
ncbi:hypothetical protein E4U38_001108 [Claviceps purpurea]|nr:hypothetical protein E4U38_001108 [Claviceps purpurea]KAG6185454.1 hypothetical protein E4U27_000510 [Claviceps purpurea]KAG6215519.1 hypothetical protein E4U50_007342 [Claviceps purpurea]KAG6279162.1 hypothetical protein E4U48_000166 [Claviceps purpurea]